MERKISTLVMPTFFSSVRAKPIHYSKYDLPSAKITALHYHDVMEIGVCLRGRGITYVGNYSYDFKQGDVQIVSSGVPHLSMSERGEKTTWVWTSFDPKTLIREVGLNNSEEINKLLLNEKLINGVFDSQDFPKLTQIIVDACEQASVESEVKKLSLALATVNLLIESERISKTNPSLLHARRDGVMRNSINSVIEYVENNLDDNENLTEVKLASLISVSQPTLRRLFISQTGYPPKTFILRSKMALAEWLLAETKLSVTEISLKVGYSDQSGFNRVFKKFYKCSPVKYRKLNSR